MYPSGQQNGLALLCIKERSSVLSDEAGSVHDAELSDTTSTHHAIDIIL